MWTGSLGNVCNARFREVWTITADTYRRAMRETLELRLHPLHYSASVARTRSEMGVGKTLGAYLYLGLLAQATKDMPPVFKLGGLMVCRTIQQCDDALRAINSYAGFVAALACHTEADATLDRATAYPVLVITHAGLATATRQGDNSRLGAYQLWREGPRCLIIIDEALANVVQTHEVNEQWLLSVLAQVPPDVRDRHALAVEIIDGLRDHLRERASITEDQLTNMWGALPKSETEFTRKLQKLLDLLIKDIRTHKLNDTVDYGGRRFVGATR